MIIIYILFEVNSYKGYHDKLKRIRSIDSDNEMYFTFLKSVYGTSGNAVKTQIWIAVSMFVMVAIIKKRLNLQLSF